ncbi:MAG TPA: hypothetical protein VMO20_06110, partial [Candidatus Acidoferrum sp.]|nr:hypothetical protein [Candidatus Acidoferrum sp.]
MRREKIPAGKNSSSLYNAKNGAVRKRNVKAKVKAALPASTVLHLKNGGKMPVLRLYLRLDGNLVKNYSYISRTVKSAGLASARKS